MAYVVRRHAGPGKEGDVLDWRLANFRVAPAAHEQMLRARNYGWNDFEDAVVAASAEATGCRFILSRNVPDFRTSVVPAITPEEFLATGIQPITRAFRLRPAASADPSSPLRHDRRVHDRRVRPARDSSSAPASCS